MRGIGVPPQECRWLPTPTFPTLPFPRDSILDIAPQARELLHRQPIARVRTLVGDEAWLVTGYEYDHIGHRTSDIGLS